MKQTAVEWLAEQITTFKWKMSDVTDRNSIIEQAKAMEKEQKIEFAFDFYYDFSNQLGVPFNLISENRTNAEKYYNETFKSE
jgi:hypothetical protein